MVNKKEEANIHYQTKLSSKARVGIGGKYILLVVRNVA